MPRVRTWASAHRLDLLTLVAIVAVVVLLWLPFGWNVSALTDEWVYYSAIEDGSASLVHFDSIRALNETGLVLAHALTPDSFIGLNLLFALLLAARGFAVYLFARELLPSAPAVATAASVLYVVHYGDLGWFWLVTFNISLSMLFTFLALWLLLRQFRQPVRWRWLAIGLTQALALTYEGAFPLIFAAPLLLPFVAGRINRRVLVTAALWYIVPLLLLIRYGVAASTDDHAYQSNQLTTALSSESPLRDMVNSVIRIYKRLLGGAFFDRYRMWRETLPTLPYAAAIAIVSLGALWYSLRRQPPVLRWREALAAGIAALAIIGLGFASYLLSEYRDVDYRVYYFSAAGSALLFTTALFAISYGGKWVRRSAAAGAVVVALIIAPRLGKLTLVVGGLLALLVPARWLFLLGCTVLIGLHASFTLWQHRLYDEAPQGQHWILSAMIEQAPRPADGTMLVLLDDSPDSRALLEFENRRDMLIGAVRYLYGNPTLDAAFCVPGEAEFGLFHEACAFEPDGFHTRWTKFVLDERIVPYANLLVFTFDEDQGVRLLDTLPATIEGYAPATIAGIGEALPPRVFSALEDFPTEKPDAPISWPLLH